MIHELPRIVRPLVHGILATHLDVAAEWNRIDAIVSFAPTEADETLAEANGELLHPYTQPLGHGVVAEFVYQNHETQDGNYSDK
jgi:hypothetical protein